MKPQSPLTELTEQAKQLIASINGLSAWNAKTPEEQTFDHILQYSKGKIEESVETIKIMQLTIKNIKMIEINPN